MNGSAGSPSGSDRRVAAVAALLLAVFWFALPARFTRTGADGDGDECLTIADRVPSQPLATLERCHSVASTDAVLTADLAAAYESAGRGTDAVRLYREAIALDPNDAEPRIALASLLFSQGAVADAKAQAEAALTLQPNRASIVAFLAKVASP